jgi:general secretion pathway protein D
MLEIEILEADRSVMRDFGVSLSEYGVQQALAQGSGDADTGQPAGISLNDLRSINAADWFFQVPSIRYQFMRQEGDFKIMAQPRMRVSEGNTSSLLIGEEVPVVETTFSTTGTVGGNVVPFSSTTYREVGIVLSATPRVHHNREITIELDLEISAVSRMEQVTPTLALPVFTTRKVSTSLRLREGETNVLAGLLRDDERTSVTGVMGLSRIPLLGNLFGATADEVMQTDVIMSITPHIIQLSDIAAEDLEMLTLSGQGTLRAPVSGAADTTGLEPGEPPGGVGAAGGADRPEAVVAGAEAGGAAAAAGEQAPAAVPPAEILLSPAQVSTSVGEEFSVDVRIENATDAGNLTLNFFYDGSFLEFVDSSTGGFLSRDGAQTALQVTPSGPGRLIISAQRAPEGGGISGSGSLVTLRFRSIAFGESLMSMQGSALQDPAGNVLEARFWGARVVSQ